MGVHAHTHTKENIVLVHQGFSTGVPRSPKVLQNVTKVSTGVVNWEKHKQFLNFECHVMLVYAMMGSD